MTEDAVVFDCAGESLVGVVHIPQNAASVGVVVVVGGPSYRVGSHRQFVLLARRLAAAGYAVLRFDYRGMGDSTGEPQPFEALAEDIGAAAGVLRRRVEAVDRIVLFGLCDAATGICLALDELGPVAGIVLLNPWVRSEQTLAKSYVKHYYWRRALSRDFWRKLVTGRLDLAGSLTAFTGHLRRAVSRRAQPVSPAAGRSLADRLIEGASRFEGPILTILSGRDMTAAEFLEAVRDSSEWQAVAGRESFTRHDLAAANHTFSSREWRRSVEDWILEWLERVAA